MRRVATVVSDVALLNCPQDDGILAFEFVIRSATLRPMLNLAESIIHIVVGIQS